MEVKRISTFGSSFPQGEKKQFNIFNNSFIQNDSLSTNNNTNNEKKVKTEKNILTKLVSGVILACGAAGLFYSELCVDYMEYCEKFYNVGIGETISKNAPKPVSFIKWYFGHFK